MRRLVVSLPIVLLAACGGGSDGPSGDPIAVLTAAPDATLDAATARVAFTIEMSGDMDATMQAEGVVDFANQRGRLEMDLGALMEQFGAPGDMDGTMEMVTDGTTMYMRTPMLAMMGAPDVDEATWLRFDLAEMTRQQGLGLDQLTGGGTNDPRQGLALLKGAGDVREVGEDDVRGEPTTHYQGTVDIEKAAKEAGSVIDEEAFRAFIDMLPSASIEVDAWVDDDGRVRKMSFGMPMPEIAGEGTIETTIEFYDFGVDPGIEIPTDAVDAADVLPMGGMGASGTSDGMTSDENGY